MRRFSLYLLTMFIFAACSDAAIDESCPIPAKGGVPESIYVSLDDETSRVQLNAEGKTVWNKDDLLTVFYHTDGNSQFKFKGETGDRGGSFTAVEMNEGSNAIEEVVLLYPYSSDYKLNATKRSVKVNIPAEQHYSAGSYGVGANLMASVGLSDDFSLKSLCGWISIQLKGAGSVTSVTLTGNNSEQLAGDATFHYDDMSLELLYYPSAPEDDSEVGGSLIFGDLQESITLICDEPVALHYSEPTEFYFVVPPQSFLQGITIEATCSDGTVLTKSTSKALTIERNHIVPMAPLTVMEQQPANEIWYTSTDGEIVEPHNGTVFGANIVSNSYKNGKGVITFDGPVTAIGEHAFNDCSGLTTITIPDSVTTIGDYVFVDCDGLTSITIPNSVTAIGIWAFQRCTGLTCITIPDNVTEIGESAFQCCYGLTAFYGKLASEDNRCLIVDGVLNSFAPAGLTSYTVPDRVTTIGEFAFLDCDDLTCITIPDNVTMIGESAFQSCDGLITITIPESVTEIGEGAFERCNRLTAFYGKYASEDNRCLIVDGALNAFARVGLTSYAIPENVTEIDDYTFYNCPLTTISIPGGVMTIGRKVFACCYGLTTIYCEAVTPPSAILDGYPAWYAFDAIAEGAKIYVPAESVEAYKTADGWSDYADMITPMSNPTNEIWYTSTDGKIVEPNNATRFGTTLQSNTYTNGKGVMRFDGPVTAIGDYAFSSCDDLKSITIPGSVTEIGENAFYRCTGLSAFYGKYASEDNRCLIVDGVLRSFARAGLTSYSIPNDITEIEDYTFQDCTGLTSITIPDSVTTIGENAFYGCTGLTIITIPDGVTSIGMQAFWGCTGLTSLTIPESVISIGHNSFGYCDGLTAFYGKYASEDNRCLIVNGFLNSFARAGLTSYTIPDGVTTIQPYVFSNCSGLSSITIPNGVTSIGYFAFCNCSGLKTIIIPDSIISIGQSAFKGCTGLTTITIPDGVTSIISGAFYGCSGLTSVTIPSSVKKVGWEVFKECYDLTTIYCEAVTPPSAMFYGNEAWSAFNNISAGAKIYVPTESVEAYKTADGWSDYADMIVGYDF